MRLQAEYLRLQGGYLRLQGGYLWLQGGYLRLQGGYLRLRGGRLRLQGGYLRLQGGYLRLRGGHLYIEEVLHRADEGQRRGGAFLDAVGQHLPSQRQRRSERRLWTVQAAGSSIQGSGWAAWGPASSPGSAEHATPRRQAAPRGGGAAEDARSKGATDAGSKSVRETRCAGNKGCGQQGVCG